MSEITKPELRVEVYILKFYHKGGKMLTIAEVKRKLQDMATANDNSLLQFVLTKFIKQADGYRPPKNKSSKTFRVEKGDLKLASYHSEIFGAITGGHVGIAGAIESFSEAQSLSEFSASDVSARKHFFAIQLPENRDFGLFLVQAYSGLNFSSELKAYVASAFQGLEIKVDFRRWVPNALLKEYSKALVKEIRISSGPRKKNKSKNHFADYAVSESVLRSVLTTTGNFGPLRTFLASLKEGKLPIPEFGDFEDPEAVVQLKLTHNGKPVTYSLVNGDFMPVMILNESNYDYHGRLKSESIHSEFRMLISNLESEMSGPSS